MNCVPIIVPFADAWPLPISETAVQVWCVTCDYQSMPINPADAEQLAAWHVAAEAS